MSLNINITLLIFIIKFNIVNLCLDNSLLPPKYYLLEKCHRSKLGITAKANYKSVASCKKFGIEKRALAINFSPPGTLLEDDEPLDYNCEVLKCAEAAGGLSLINDTRFDYYSLYAKPLPHVNSTCVPATGMFFLVPTKLNYSGAEDHCQNMTATLADVTSEQRTESLATLLHGAKVEAAFVGLRRDNGSSFFSVTGDTLDCTTYRAWSPGHPHRRWDEFECVVLTSRNTWRTTSCKKKYPVLCELLPGGPYRRGSIFKSAKRNDTNVEASPVASRNDKKPAK